MKSKTKQRGVISTANDCILYDTSVVKRKWISKRNYYLEFRTDGWITRSTCKAINNWITEHTNLCIKARIIKGIAYIEAQSKLDGVMELYSMNEYSSTILESQYIREKKLNE